MPDGTSGAVMESGLASFWDCGVHEKPVQDLNVAACCIETLLGPAPENVFRGQCPLIFHQVKHFPFIQRACEMKPQVFHRSAILEDVIGGHTVSANITADDLLGEPWTVVTELLLK